MSKIEGAIAWEADVTPHWVTEDAFWYRKQTRTWRNNPFLLVNITSKSVQPAFDHSQLARELGDRTNKKIDPLALPFTSISISPDFNFIQFLYDGHGWRYDSIKGSLELGGIPSLARKSIFLRRQLPSESWGSLRASLNVTNNTKDHLKIFWVDGDGKPVFNCLLELGGTKHFNSYPGDVWRLERQSSKLRAIYCVPGVGHHLVEVSDADLEERDDESLAPGEPDDREDAYWRTIKEKHEVKIDADISVCDSRLWITHGSDSPLQISSDDLVFKDLIFASPRGSFLVAWEEVSKEDRKSVQLTDDVPFGDIEPVFNTSKQPLPGEQLNIHRPRLFDLTANREVTTDNSLFANPVYLNNLGWSTDEEEYRFLFTERGFRCVRILGMHRSGAMRVILEEKSSTFIDNTKKYFAILKDCNRMIWASERSGYNHFYIVSLNGGSIQHQITSGAWNVKNVERIDEEKGIIWVAAYGFNAGEDPYHVHLVRASLNGDLHCQVVTDGDGTHEWWWSPDGLYIVDRWSRVDLPPRTAVRCAMTGKTQIMLEGVKANALEGWVSPERFAATGRDGTTPIYGIIIRPVDFDASKKYPVLECIYSGPQDFYTPKKFGRTGALSDWAKEGYVAIQMDGMGTNWRSKRFHNVCYKNIMDSGLPDRTLWIKEAAKTRPWIDLSRVGIVGRSAGGMNAVSALLHHEGLYKAAASDCGFHDCRLGTGLWSEQWMGYPVDASYAENSTATHVGKLQNGKELLLVVGGKDEVVSPAATINLARKLDREDKPYRFVLIPDGGHGCGTEGDGLRKIKEFFKECFH